MGILTSSLLCPQAQASKHGSIKKIESFRFKSVSKIFILFHFLPYEKYLQGHFISFLVGVPLQPSKNIFQRELETKSVIYI